MKAFAFVREKKKERRKYQQMNTRNLFALRTLCPTPTLHCKLYTLYVRSPFIYFFVVARCVEKFIYFRLSCWWSSGFVRRFEHIILQCIYSLLSLQALPNCILCRSIYFLFKFIYASACSRAHIYFSYLSRTHLLRSGASASRNCSVCRLVAHS